MTTIYYAIARVDKDTKSDIYNSGAMDVIFIEPVSAFSYISDRRNWTDNNCEHYLTCPAVSKYCKNTYFILSPYDEKIYIDKETKSLVFSQFSQAAFDSHIENRGADLKSIDDPYLLTLPPSILFWTDDDSVLIESFNCFLETAPFQGNVNVIPGMFDIGKWVRPIDWTFEIKDTSQPLVINRGDPMFAVRFTPKDGGNVTLVRKQLDNDMFDLYRSFVDVKNLVRKKNFNYLYKAAEPFIKLWKSKKKKCPFGFGK